MFSKLAWKSVNAKIARLNLDLNIILNNLDTLVESGERQAMETLEIVETNNVPHHQWNNDKQCRQCGIGMYQAKGTSRCPGETVGRLQTLLEFEERCVTTLKCEECDAAFSSWDGDTEVARMAYKAGWRFQPFEFNGVTSEEKRVLCLHCKDGKR